MSIEASQAANGFKCSPQQLAAWQSREMDTEASFWRLRSYACPEILDAFTVARRIVVLATTFEVLRTKLQSRPDGELVQAVGSAPDDALRTAWPLERPLPDAATISVLWRLESGASGQELVLATSRLLLDDASSERVAAGLLEQESSTSEVLQYADYTSWARQQAALAGEPGAAPRWPLPRAAESGVHRWVSELESRDAARLSAMAPSEARATALAVVAMTVRKLTGESEVAVDVVSSGRSEAPLASNLGLFEVVSRHRLACTPARAVAQLVAEAAQVLEAAGRCTPRPEPSDDAGAQFSWESSRALRFIDGGAAARAGLRLSVIQHANGLRLDWAFQSAWFDAAAGRAVAASYEALLRQTLDNAQRPVHSLAVAAEGHLLVQSGPRPTITGCLIARFDAIAQQRGEDIAIVGDRTVGFAELQALSCDYAARLAAEGVSAGDTVALILEPSAQWVAMALATMRLGACHAPIDPAQPALRVRGMIERLQPRLVVSDGAMDFARVLLLERDWRRPATPPMPARPPEDGSRKAYVLHTSGSTGQPKSVAVSEASLLNYVHWALHEYDVAKIDASILHTSLAVDLTVTSLWVPLLAGKPVEILPATSPIAALAQRLREPRAWFLKVTPSHLRALNQLAEIERRGPGSAAVLVIGGEELRHEDVVPWFEANPQLRAYNEYGPTETTVGCSVHRLDAAPTPGPVPVGRPIANTDLYVADVDGHPLRPGMPGELIIGGRGVAIGYLNGADASARPVFFDDGLLGSRAYRSGDRVVLDTDVGLRLLGRIDEQIKLHGHRIEPAEVEAALRDTGMVKEAAVLVVRHRVQGDSLVAYCVTGPGQTLDTVALRRELLQHLPTPMVPNAYVQVPALPLGLSGKRDLDAMQRLYPVHSVGFARYVAPRSLTEDVLASVWGHVLGIERVGIDDDYFALGGDSLRSVQITALAEQRGVRLSLPMLHQHPTVRALAAAIEASRDSIDVEQTRPFELLSEADRHQLPEGVVDAYPLNLLQEGMIYHREFSPKSAVYHAICSYHVKAPFDAALMRRCVQDLVNRHPLLRTSFDLSGYSRPIQLVHAAFDDPMGYHDLGGLGPQQQQLAVDEWMEVEKKRGFELEEFPLIRFMVHRMSDSLFQLSYSFHHEIIDGWSDALMVTELMTQYMSSINGHPEVPSPPTSTFRDSIRLEQKALANPAFERFWRDRLDDVNVMRLPNLRPPKADKGEREIVKFEVPVSQRMSDSIKALAKTLAVPLKTVLLAAHLKVMGMVGGHEDVMTYTVGNGRPENRDGHAVIGLFVNSLAFRQKLKGGSWADLIHDTLKTEHELLPYRRYPMAELKRQHGSEPLSETLFFFNNYHVAEALERWENLSLLGLKVYAESTFPFCINAFVEPFTHKLRMRIEYDRLQYSQELMTHVSDCYFEVLQAMIANPGERYDARPLMPQSLQRVVAQAGAGPERKRSAGRTVLDLFLDAAQRQPEAPALVCGETVLSYGQLQKSVERVACGLQARRLRAGSTIMVASGRGMEPIIGMLGAMRAGIAYVPVELPMPSERLAFLARDAGAAMVLTRRVDADAEALIHSPVPLVTLEELQNSAPAVLSPASGAGIAYVIYTSGTTGRPKGVAVDHAALLQSTLARQDYYPASPSAFLLLSSHAFDSSVAGIYGTLCFGGVVVLPQNAAQLEAGELWQLVLRSRCSHLLAIPALYSALIEEAPPAGVAESLRGVIVAGEACPRELVLQHGRQVPGVKLYNEYGPTEATVWCTVHECAASDTSATAPIGRAVANVYTRVLDHDMHPVAFGVPGQLYVGGQTLALGYLGNPGLTASRFVPDPAGAPGARLYTTGDIVRQRADGVLEFLGRNDQMVKVQGFRVELAEIEQLLEQHPSVRRALVQVRADEAARKALVAYVLPAEASVDVAELRSFVKRSLPKYMIPADFVVIDTIPVKASGKIDYAALPAPQQRPTSRRQPSTATEQAVADIWRNVLGLEEIGVEQDFLELGGESLRALRIVSKVRRAFNVKLPLSGLLSQPVTIVEMARLIDEARGSLVESA